MKSKIKTESELLKEMSQLKLAGKTIVTYNGSFDILHAGHIRSLAEAKSMGDILIVPLNSDKSIRANKGPNRPINPEAERAEMLAALAAVDYVVIFNERDPRKILAKIKPDIHCNGADYGYNCIEKDVVEKNRGKIHILKWQPGLSTTNLINKIIKAHKK